MELTEWAAQKIAQRSAMRPTAGAYNGGHITAFSSASGLPVVAVADIRAVGMIRTHSGWGGPAYGGSRSISRPPALDRARKRSRPIRVTIAPPISGFG